MQFSDGTAEMAAIDTAAAFAIVSEGLCKQHNLPIDRIQTRSITSLGDGRGGWAVGTAALTLEGINLEYRVVPRSNWPLFLPFHRLHSKQVNLRLGSPPTRLEACSQRIEPWWCRPQPKVFALRWTERHSALGDS